MNTRTLRVQAYPALLAGTGRRPLNFRGDLAEVAQDDACRATLTVLSLTGQAMRFERPLAPPSFAVESVVQDKWPVMPDRWRRPLLRLLKDRSTSNDLTLALAWRFEVSRVRPHPFDLPKMDAFVRANSEHLGTTAQQWAQQRGYSHPASQGYFDAEEMDESTWARGTPGQRARFIAETRRQDASAARALVEAAWSQENADTRVRLLMALEAGLHAGDQPFLESIGKDRAPRVRALAQRLLGRLTGERGENPALAACLERIQRTTAGLLKKRVVLSLELPATVKEHEAKAWLRKAFAEVSFEELARALELSEAQVMDAAEKDANLSLALALVAIQDQRFDLLEQLTKSQLSDAWEQLSQCGPVDVSMMAPEERSRLAGIFIATCDGKLPASLPAWSWLHRVLEGPAPPSLIELVLRSNDWLTGVLEENRLGSEWMEILVALCASTRRGRLRALMTNINPALTQTALPLIDILDSLEKTGRHEQR